MPTSRRRLRPRESRKERVREKSRCRKVSRAGSPARGEGVRARRVQDVRDGEEDRAMGTCREEAAAADAGGRLDKESCGRGDVQATDPSWTSTSAQSHGPLTPLGTHVHKDTQTGDDGDV